MLLSEHEPYHAHPLERMFVSMWLHFLALGYIHLTCTPETLGSRKEKSVVDDKELKL
jgi:hypothetical protein